MDVLFFSFSVKRTSWRRPLLCTILLQCRAMALRFWWFCLSRGTWLLLTFEIFQCRIWSRVRSFLCFCLSSCASSRREKMAHQPGSGSKLATTNSIRGWIYRSLDSFFGGGGGGSIWVPLGLCSKEYLPTATGFLPRRGKCHDFQLGSNPLQAEIESFNGLSYVDL